MSKYEDNFNLDDILAEFSSDGETDFSPAVSTPPALKQKAVIENKKPEEIHVRRKISREQPADDIPPVIRRLREPRIQQEPPQAKEPRREKEPGTPKPIYIPEPEYNEPDEDTESRRKASGAGRVMISLLFFVISIAALAWTGINIHPDSGTATAASVRNTIDLVSRLDVAMNNAKSEALKDLAYIKKIYTIDENATAAPRPNEAAFGVTTDMAEIQAVIDSAADLLDGQSVVWNPDLDFYPDRNVYYYRDPTILVLVWRERINNRSTTVAEIKVADGSQLRRKLSEDSYGSSVQAYCSKLAADANAVIAMNADYYGFRQVGVTVYQRQLFRFSPDKLDNCFINSKGEMLFMKAGSITDEMQMRQYINDNDVLFSLSFGPILVDNGELQYCDSYPIGEMNLEYSRAGLGMMDELHYIYMTVNHCNGQNPRCNINQFAEIMHSKGCIKAYNLDGGQTSEIVMHGKPINYIDFNAERTVTDIIYFATALPESEVSR